MKFITGDQFSNELLELLGLCGVIVIALSERDFDLRIRHAEVSEQLEVGEFKEGDIELCESSHHAEVDIKGKPLVEFVRGDPGNLLAHELNPVVDALDREERLGEALGDRAVKHEVSVQLRTNVEGLLFDIQS